MKMNPQKTTLPDNPAEIELSGMAPRATGLVQWRRAWASLVRARTPLFGLIVIVCVILVALFAPLLAPHNPENQELRSRLKPPFWVEGSDPNYILGTDALGRDLLSRLIYGARISLLVGFVTAGISGVVGIILGLLAGYFGGLVDSLISRLIDIQLAFPFVLLALTLVAILGGGLLNVILVLGIGGWMAFARIIRVDTLSLKHREFIIAAHCLGVPTHRIILRHILPNVLAPMIVIGSFSVSTNIIYEAALTFLGVGVSAEIPTWGSMLADGRDYLGTGWWISTLPGLAIMVTVIGINFLGDWFRDVLDPRIGFSR
jgi:peptide/nickel transport system permease protein